MFDLFDSSSSSSDLYLFYLIDIQSHILIAGAAMHYFELLLEHKVLY